VKQIAVTYAEGASPVTIESNPGMKALMVNSVGDYVNFVGRDIVSLGDVTLGVLRTADNRRC
jgi:hypothetical protein